MNYLAFTYVRNELDILPWTLAAMLNQGVDVYALDNWSTDGTWEWLMEQTYQWQDRLYVERFPDKPSKYFELDPILHRLEQLHAQRRPDWGLVFGADEILEAPGGVPLATALRATSERGYTAADFMTACFQPVDDGWTPADDPAAYFRYWTLGHYQINVRAWSAPNDAITFLQGGHDMAFKGRQLCPRRFVIRHYPFRTQAQAERKVFQERKPRYSPAEHAKGWHTHFDPFQPGRSFIQDPAGLRPYNPATLYEELVACQRS